MADYAAYLINPSRRKRRRTTRRRRARRNPAAFMPNPKRRRRSSHRRRTSRRHYRRNPGLPSFARGLDIQKAALIVVGAAGAKFLANQLAARFPQLGGDPKIKAAVTLGLGVAMGKFLPIGGAMRSSLALGGQVAGVSGLLASVAPQFFAGYEADGLAGYATAPVQLGAGEYEVVSDPYAPTF